MKSPLLKTLLVGCSMMAATVWFASAADEPKAGEHHGHGDMMQATLDKLNLTDDQKAKIKVITDKDVADREEFMKAHADEVKAAKESGDKEKMHAVFAPMKEKRKAMVDAIKALLTDEQKQKFDELMPKRGGGQHEKKQQ